MSVNEEIEKIISEQGWSDETRLCYYEEFVEKMELENKFLEFIKEVAQEEENFIRREKFGIEACEYCGEKDCNFSCDESQAGGFQK